MWTAPEDPIRISPCEIADGVPRCRLAGLVVCLLDRVGVLRAVHAVPTDLRGVARGPGGWDDEAGRPAMRRATWCRRSARPWAKT